MIALPTPVAAALEAALDAVLRLDPDSREKLAALAGKVVAVELAGFGLRFYLAPGPGGLKVFSHYEGEPDALIEGSPVGLAAMGLARRAEDSLLSGEVRMRGDVALAQRLREILEGLDLDWEEQLARLLGDVPAHQLGRAARGLGRWAREAGETLLKDLGEYLRYEARLTPDRAEVTAFVAAVDALRDDTERLAARVERLERRRREEA